MSYRNKTYVIFDADIDMHYYRTMQMWKANDHIDFDFYNAHDLNTITSRAEEEQIKRKLRERMKNTKQVIVLVGRNTKNLYKFVRWEIDIALEMDLPIIAVNLDGANRSTQLTPPILKNYAYFLNIPFGVKKIKYALDNFPSAYETHKNESPSSRVYNWSKIKL